MWDQEAKRELGIYSDLNTACIEAPGVKILREVS